MSWLVLEITKSGTQLGIITAVQFVPVLVLGLWGGLVADHFSKRTVLIGTTVVSGALSGVLALLVMTHAIQLWMLYVIAAMSGLIMVVDNPARQAFVGEMVGRNRIRNAITLNSMIFNITRVVGPSIAGVAIARFGVGLCFLMNALSFIAVLISLVMMKADELHVAERRESVASLRHDVAEGVRYALSITKIRTALLMMLIIGAFTYEFSVSYPLFATQVLHGDASTYGVMMAWMGVGSILGGLWMAKYPVKQAKMLVPFAALFGGSTLFLAFAHSMSAAALTLVAIGVGSTLFATLGNSTLQVNSSPQMRGRVMSLWTMAFTGVTPIGAPIVGLIGAQLGADTAIAFSGGAAIIAAWAGYALLRAHRRVARRAAAAESVIAR